MFVSALTCPRCGRTHDASKPHNVCDCGSPLLVEYGLGAVGGAVRREDIAARPPDMWRYRELLPLAEPEKVTSLGEGFTPLIPVPGLARELHVSELWVKEDGLNPTGSFKARGAAAGVARAKELGIHEVALPTAGNAGGAWACYGAAAGIRVHVAM
ncbi:MAG: pyridoxal-phosphate dependent enzyme, partial [Actinomycetota bacterium]